jgi:hypothetical protein
VRFLLAGTAGYLIGNYLDAAITSRAPAATALSTGTWTGTRATKIDNLDATVSSRAPAGGGTTPTNPYCFRNGKWQLCP